MKIRTFIVYVENEPGVLNRVASLFRRRSYNIESLAVGPTHLPGTSRMCIQVATDDDHVAAQIQAHLYKLVSVLYVEDVTDTDAIFREMLLIKVKVNHATRAEVTQLALSFKADIVDTDLHSVSFVLTARPNTVNRAIQLFESFGILDLQRTGTVAMVRGAVDLPTALTLPVAPLTESIP